MKAPTFYDHPALQPLVGPLRQHTLRQLHTITGAGEPSAPADPTEAYATAVFERVGELQNGIDSMRLALFAVMDLPERESSGWREYQYHYENFLLRLTGVSDRAHRLVGTSLCLAPSKFEKPGGNTTVVKSIPRTLSALVSALAHIEAVTGSKRRIRNEVAHSNAFSTRELSLFSTIEQLNFEDFDPQEVRGLMVHHFRSGGAELAGLLGSLVQAVNQLLAALAPVISEHGGGTSSMSNSPDSAL